jgi:peptidoglycan/xylan/chitin deacetylase (PgdA/CDA1 family)
MRAFGFTYHDVTPLGERSTSGFTGPGAEHYKLSPEQFAAHLDAIAASGAIPARVTDPPAAGRNLFLTFDDGGVAAGRATAPLLAAHAWPGHFFITTGQLGRTGFLTTAGARELSAAGHVIGSHSHTHPFMTRLTDAEVREEWQRSREILEELLGVAVETASVPAGFYAPRIGRLAAEAGYRYLFTSEPWTSPRSAGGASVYGRFSIVATTPPGRVAALCRLEPLVRWREAGRWQARKLAKVVLGPAYFWLRRSLLARREQGGVPAAGEGRS